MKPDEAGHYIGMSLRAYFAAKAMQGVLIQSALLSAIVLVKGNEESFAAELDAELAAAKAVEYADALIAELNK